jgi:hypothetical protein
LPEAFASRVIEGEWRAPGNIRIPIIDFSRCGKTFASMEKSELRDFCDSSFIGNGVSVGRIIFPHFVAEIDGDRNSYTVQKRAKLLAGEFSRWKPPRGLFMARAKMRDAKRPVIGDYEEGSLVAYLREQGLTQEGSDIITWAHRNYKDYWTLFTLFNWYLRRGAHLDWDRAIGGQGAVPLKESELFFQCLLRINAIEDDLIRSRLFFAAKTLMETPVGTYGSPFDSQNWIEFNEDGWHIAFQGVQF